VVLKMGDVALEARKWAPAQTCMEGGGIFQRKSLEGRSCTFEGE